MRILNLKSSFLLTILLSSALFIGTGCRQHAFKIKGEIYGAENLSMALEKPDFQGQWVAIDSIHINRNGGFTFSFPAPATPEIYRLSLNGQYLYFPVEDTETLSINTSYDKFGRDFNLTGTNEAEKLGNFEKDLHGANISHPDSMNNFKRMVYSKYIKDAPGSIVNFYILTKTVDGKPLYSPSDPQDRKYFGAVATGFKSVRPDDPHTALLENTTLQALRQKSSEEGKYLSIEAEEITLIDIAAQDENGNMVKLSDVAGKGKPVVVIFSALNLPESPELNMALANIYRKHAGNVEFYNVSLDEDQYAWREAARNLPWITVYSPGQGASEDAIHYNVYELPSYFIYNSEGELTDRPLTLQQLDKSL